MPRGGKQLALETLCKDPMVWCQGLIFKQVQVNSRLAKGLNWKKPQILIN